MTKLYPQEPTKWTTALEKVYRDQSESLERYHDQLRERDRQMVEKAKNENIARVFKGFESLSATVGTALELTEPLRDKRHKKKTNTALVDFTANKDREIILKGIRLKYEAEKGNASSQKALDILITQLKDDNNLEAAAAIESAGPRSSIHKREAMALYERDRLTTKNFLNYLNNSNKKEDSDKLNIYNATTDQRVKDILFAEWVEDSLDYLNLGSTFKTAIFGQELIRQSTSRHNADKNTKNFNIATAKQAEIGAQIELRSNNPEELFNFLTEYEKELETEYPKDIIGDDGKTITVQQQIKKRIFKDLMAASLDYKITTPTLAAYLQWGFPTKSRADGVGTPENTYFSKEQINQLIAASITGATRLENIVRTKHLAIYDEAKLLSLTGNKEEADKKMRPVKAMGLLDPKLITDYDNIDPEKQTAEYEAERDEYYSNLDLQGKLPSVVEINKEPNNAMNKKWSAIKTAKDKFKTDHKLSYNPEATYSNDVSMMRNKKALEKDQVLVGDDLIVAGKLVEYSNIRLSWYLKQDRDNKTQTPNIEGLVKKDVEDFKIQNGWGTENKPGMFSLDTSVQGSPKWSNINTVSEDYGYGYNHNKISETREQDYLRNKQLYPKKKDRHAAPEGIFSNRQMLGFKENLKFSEDMKWIANEEGLDLFTAYNLAIESMDDEFAKLHNFEQLPEEAEAGLKAYGFIAETIEKALNSKDPRIRAGAIRDLRYKLKYQGYDTFTPNDIQMLVDIGTFKNDLKVEEDTIEEEEQQQQPNTQVPTAEDRLNLKERYPNVRGYDNKYLDEILKLSEEQFKELMRRLDSKNQK